VVGARLDREAGEQRMTLVDLCDILFQYIARLNRGARKGLSPDMAQVRADIKGIFGEMRSKSGAMSGLGEQYDKIEIVLMYFVDFMIKESRLTFARQWQELAHERNKLAGDEDFFDDMDRTLAEPDTESARARLAVVYVCLGLGFTGWYTGNPQHLRGKMNEIASRVRGIMDADKAAKVCPEAYENVNTKPMDEPIRDRLVYICILFAGLTVAALVANSVFYRASSKLIGDSAIRVEKQANTGVPVP